MELVKNFKIGDKVKITDIDNYKDYMDYYDVPKISDEYLSDTTFTVKDFEARLLVDDASELENSDEDIHQYELVDNNGRSLDLMIDAYALEKVEV
ncbi:hypothetical protein NDL58_002603 [Staphylococcus pseudintermedius]|nr:hypothetical protein [Staphylococcus pseudintermedius]